MSPFELVECHDGTYTLRDRANGQTMHSSVGAWAEAMMLYAEPTDLSGACTVLDVGMGLATNPLALIWRWRAERGGFPLRILSLENQLDGLRTALAQSERFAWLERDRELIEKLLQVRKIDHGNLQWELWEGDLAAFARPGFSADIIYFDMYSPSVVPDQWSPAIFEKMREAGAPRHKLLTYSAARRVRDALSQAGYAISEGPPTPLKRNTTIASL